MQLIRSATAGVVFVAFLAFASACESEAPSGSAAAPGGAQPQNKLEPSLARANIDAATAAAKGWQGDAVLIQIAKGGVKADGKQVMWDYGFFSPSAKKCVVVNVAPGGASTAESGDETCASAEIKEFMDSDKASGIARSNGITAAEATMVVMAGAKGAAVWSVMDERGMKPGNVMLDIDAVSGAVLHKTSQ